MESHIIILGKTRFTRNTWWRGWLSQNRRRTSRPRWVICHWRQQCDPLWKGWRVAGKIGSSPQGDPHYVWDDALSARQKNVGNIRLLWRIISSYYYMWTFPHTERCGVFVCLVVNLHKWLNTKSNMLDMVVKCKKYSKKLKKSVDKEEYLWYTTWALETRGAKRSLKIEQQTKRTKKILVNNFEHKVLK